VVAAGDPEGEMAAGGVTRRDDAGGVERIAFRKLGDEVEAGGGVVKGVGPAATGEPDAAVLD